MELAPKIEKIEEDENNYEYDHRRNDIAIEQKKFEEPFVLLLDPKKPWVIRLDGHRFSKFTRGFQKPYDMRIYEAMHRTAADLLGMFNARCAYTQSDEITLVFAAEVVEGEPIITHGGKVQKIATLAAGLCSVRFHHHMRQQVFQADKESHLLDKLDWAHFDARAFNLPSTAEVLKNIIWRQADCKANSKLNLAHHHLPQKELQNMKPKQLVEKLKAEKGVSWQEQHAAFRIGTLIKKSVVQREGFNPSTGEKVPNVSRSVLVRYYVNLVKLSPDNEQLIFEKLLPSAVASAAGPSGQVPYLEVLPMEVNAHSR